MSPIPRNDPLRCGNADPDMAALDAFRAGFVTSAAGMTMDWQALTEGWAGKDRAIMRRMRSALPCS